ncbi:hypothetical protein BD413DRAFT_238121 [Trametes elegans]|nr:hypothetical protein BD413DRAFT_238121 [Trametes elegans]
MRACSSTSSGCLNSSDQTVQLLSQARICLRIPRDTRTSIAAVECRNTDRSHCSPPESFYPITITRHGRQSVHKPDSSGAPSFAVSFSLRSVMHSGGVLPAPSVPSAPQDEHARTFSQDGQVLPVLHISIGHGAIFPLFARKHHRDALHCGWAHSQPPEVALATTQEYRQDI